MISTLDFQSRLIAPSRFQRSNDYLLHLLALEIFHRLRLPPQCLLPFVPAHLAVGIINSTVGIPLLENAFCFPFRSDSQVFPSPTSQGLVFYFKTMKTKPNHLLRKTLVTTTVITPSLHLASAAVTAGQIDTFQDGTTQGWVNTSIMVSPPLNQANTGPAGSGDNALFSFIGGNPDAFSIVNSTQWAGNYNAAGITTIRFDADNLGASSLTIGILFNGGSAGTNSVSVPVGTGWNTYSIDLTTLIFGSASTLNSVSSLELVSLANGAAISVGALDISIDNITAIPEPHSSLLTVFALTVFFRRRRK